MPDYHIYIELNSRRLILKKGYQTIGTYPVAIGKSTTPTPTGDFQVLNKIMNPGGALGSRWMKFTWQEHGIHGTNQPWLIGQAVSNGCVRMYNQDVEKVYEKVTVGTPVSIRQILHLSSGNPGSKQNSNYILYTVKKGDSLWMISKKYNVSISLIRQLNKLQNDLIYPDQKLKIPTG